VERLLAHAARDELDVCLLETERGTQPLFGVYRRACLPAVRAALEAGERRMVSFHGSLTVGALRVEADGVALNVNTPDELDRLRGEAR
jgi:molybdopterin molybdotransferase